MAAYLKSALLGACALIAASPASAATYDAFTSFDGTQGAGNFYYGEVDSTGASGALFAATTNCFIDNSTCLQLAADHDVPGFTKSTSPSFQYGSVNVPTDRLLGHPDNDSDLTVLAFLAPAASLYHIDATFNLQDISPTGITLNLVSTTGGGLPLILTPLSALSNVGDVYTYSADIFLAANDAFGFGIGNGGSYNNDSFGVNFTATAVPEPASWAMLIAGFGLAGVAMRRRATRTSVAFV